MMVAKTFQETDKFDADDPTQVRRMYYGFRYGPGYGGYQSTFFNRVAPAGTLGGLGFLTWATIPTWAQVAIVGLSSAAVGYLGMRKFGDSHVRPALKRIGLGSPRRRRR